MITSKMLLPSTISESTADRTEQAERADRLDLDQRDAEKPVDDDADGTCDDYRRPVVVDVGEILTDLTPLERRVVAGRKAGANGNDETYRQQDQDDARNRDHSIRQIHVSPSYYR